MSKIGYVYIMSNKHRTTLYIGVTNNLCRRVYEHKNHLIENSFTEKYNLEYCIYYEEFPQFSLAIKREKELKKWNRQKKKDLINKSNPEWKVLVTEKGFVREIIPFSQQVSTLLNQMEIVIPRVAKTSEETKEIPPVGRNDNRENGDKIPPVGRNDGRLWGVKGAGIGGEAADACSTFSFNAAVISSEARNPTAAAIACISSEARNPTATATACIPDEAKGNEETPVKKQSKETNTNNGGSV